MFFHGIGKGVKLKHFRNFRHTMQNYFFRFSAYFIFFISTFLSFGQVQVAGYAQKMRGEDITYFSPFRSFAKEALLTRCDGQSAIEWEAQRPNAVDGIAQFKFLIGFSCGTSAQDRFFDVYLNDSLLFTFKTEKRWAERQNFQLASNLNLTI